MPTNAETLLLDTSAAIALLDPDHVAHQPVRRLVRGRSIGLAGHAEFETYSVLTRLPGAKRLDHRVAARVIRTAFAETRHLSRAASAQLVERCAVQGIAGGAVYDCLVAATAAEHGLTLVSCDRRAAGTYRAMNVAVEWAL